MENCVALTIDRKKVIDMRCENFVCGFCEFQDIPKFRLRGMLPETITLDRYFFWTKNVNMKKFVFEGTNHDQLLSTSKNKWEIVDIHTKERILFLENEVYPMGRKIWSRGKHTFPNHLAKG